MALPLRWEACYNVRDLGGTPTQTGQVIQERALVRCDNLARLNNKGHKKLKDYGLSLILDLRDEGEREDHPHAYYDEPLYRNVPFNDPRDAAMREAVDRGETLADLYKVILTKYSERVGEAFRTVAEAPPGPVLVHCMVGKDRTGILTALLLSVAGVSDDHIIADYAKSSANLHPLMQRDLDEVRGDAARQARIRHGFSSKKESMAGTLAFIEGEYGDVPGYLRSVGVDDTAMNRVRERLLS